MERVDQQISGRFLGLSHILLRVPLKATETDVHGKYLNVKGANKKMIS